MRVEAVAGQYLDVLGETAAGRLVGGAGAARRPAQDGQLHRAAPAAVRRGAGRSGPCTTAGAADVDRAYSRYGAAVGEAFQLATTCSASYGDPAVTGKPAGDDLRTGKPTTLLMLAHQLATRRSARAGRTRRSRQPRRRLRRPTSTGSAAGRSPPPAHRPRSRRMIRRAGRRGLRRAGRRADPSGCADALTDLAVGGHASPGMMVTADRPGGAAVRTVTGPTDRVVVVGAGLGGLACALHLAGAGRQVTVVERESVPGGRAGRLGARRVRVRHRPDRADHARADRRAARRGRREPGRLARADAARPGLPGVLPGRVHAGRAHRHGPDGGRDLPRLRPPRGRRLPAVRRVRPAAVAAGARQLHRPQPRHARSTWSTSTCSSCSAWAGSGASSRRSTSTSATRVPSGSSPSRRCTPGLAPHDALAIYAVIAYLDSVAGVYFPKGGMHAVPKALAGAAEKHGVHVPLRHDGDPGRDRGRAGHRACSPPTASASRPTSWCSTPTCRSPTATCCRPAGAPPPAILAVLRGAAHRIAPGVQQDRPPQHPLRHGRGGAPSTR